MIEFTVPGDAVPWARTRVNRFGARFTPNEQRSYAGTLKQFCAAAMNGREPLQGPVELSVLAVYEWRKSLSSKKRGLPGAEAKTSRPDIDNIGKIVMDSLNTVAWSDDSQVASLHLWKKFGTSARLSVRIRSLACPADTSAPSPQTSPGVTA